MDGWMDGSVGIVSDYQPIPQGRVFSIGMTLYHPRMSRPELLIWIPQGQSPWYARTPTWYEPLPRNRVKFASVGSSGGQNLAATDVNNEQLTGRWLMQRRVLLCVMNKN